MWSDVDTTMGGSEGGFMDNSTTESDQSKSNAKRGNNLVPLMIGHLMRSSGEELQLWDIISVRVVSVVGIVRSVNEQSTKIAYEVEDETGTITALKWLEADKVTKDPLISLNTYVRVNGVVREQAGKRHILILSINALEGLNELVNHLLEVTYALLKAESMQKGDGCAVSNVSTAAQESTGGANEQGLFYGLTPEQTIVYNIVQKENATECGIERAEVQRRAPKHVQPQVNKILDFLTCEGHIYTTSTDDHFKTT